MLNRNLKIVFGLSILGILIIHERDRRRWRRFTRNGDEVLRNLKGFYEELAQERYNEEFERIINNLD